MSSSQVHFSVPIFIADVFDPPNPFTVLLLSRKGPTKSVDTGGKHPDARLSIPTVDESVTNGMIRWALIVEAQTTTDV